LVVVANVITDLLASGVWHIGLLILASARHGSGEAKVLHQGLQDWALANGPSWLRLGVVLGNARAERFWASAGYVETRICPAIQPGNGSWTRPSGPSSAALARREPQRWRVPSRGFATPPAWPRAARSGA
jgi:hypothetical protein